MILIGLTGSIAMGKSTVSAMFADEGIPIYDADAAIHELYGAGGAAVGPVETVFPGITKEDGSIDRNILVEILLRDADNNFKMLEETVAPILRAHQSAYLASVSAPIVVLDIPLLFEKGINDQVDTVVVVSCPRDVQRKRALARPGMTEEKLNGFLARQMPDAHKRARADFIINTDTSLDTVRDRVQSILAAVRHIDFVSNLTAT